MDLLIDVSTPDAAPVLVPLLQALHRRGSEWAIFFTNDGVKALSDPQLAGLLHLAEQAVACEFSWERHMGHAPCPVTIGSQTNHSMLAANAARIIGL
ncbi:hypothetical protein [Sulfurivermis fontis]|jgi:hypothetical protein|uniref:hypothetical protein n=1 Tax=Sulfurivermis fontis TaxID=1972068 RepID=UPI000FD71000|nr:hypothetical protein [Sulfurivermis fontis]